MFNLVIAATSSSHGILIPALYVAKSTTSCTLIDTSSCTWALVTVLVNRLVINQCRERQRLRFSVYMKADLVPVTFGSQVMVSRGEAYEMENRASADTVAAETLAVFEDSVHSLHI